MVERFPVIDPGLGNTSYLVDLGDGSALVIDPERDPRPYLSEASRRRLQIRHVAETHLHADFVSGARELVALGATLIAPKDSRLAHPHQPVGDGDEVQVGDLVLRAIATPGHTPEHVAYLLLEESTPQVVFTGGTLMAGGVARPDLITPDLTIPLARQAHHSVRRLLTTLPDDVEVEPTHGAGSFCSSAGASRSDGATIASERRSHPVMTTPDVDRFVDELLSELGTYPPYFHRLREVNRSGPTIYGVDLFPLPTVGVEDVAAHLVIDVRRIDRFAAGHLPGSVSIELRPEFGTWLGWLVEPEVPLIFVLDPDQNERELVRQALNVGHEAVRGRIELAHWAEAGGRLTTIDLIPGTAIPPGAPILDVRQSSEWQAGHVPSAVHIELGDLAANSARIDGPAVVHCGHGQRAMTAASLLARAGQPPTGVTTADYTEISRFVPSS